MSNSVPLNEGGLTAAASRRPTLAAIALGSNLGSNSGSNSGSKSGPNPGSNETSGWGGREGKLREAIRRVGALGRVVAVSSFYDTEPVGAVEQPRFLNGALLLETEMEPVALMRGLLEVERAMGRVREAGVVKGPRVIDLDLLLFGDRVMSTAKLTLPHPAMHERRFVLEPLRELAPGMVHPVLGKTVAEMLEGLKA